MSVERHYCMKMITKEKSLTRRILSAVKESAMTAADVVEVILEMPYGSSYGRMQRAVDRKVWERESEKILKDKQRRVRNLLSKLKREGLVSASNDGFWKITKTGLVRLCQKRNGLPSGHYKKEADSTFKLIMFDIPEKSKQKRVWIRDCLKRMGFKMIQKSVWMGKTKIPEEFIKDLSSLNLVDCVSILEITKFGSLSQLS